MDLLTWSKFNCYTFYEKTHQYFFHDKPVHKSVTQFVSEFFEPFDKEGVSEKYAKKHGLSQQEVLQDWEKKGNISSISGTIIHGYLENYARGKVFELDYSAAQEAGVLEEVKERVKLLLPQAEKFHHETLNKLIPIQLEYTVGIEDLIAGNIDLLCWNVRDGEFQIWDYKNLKEFTTYSVYKKKALKEFSNYDDCHLVHYSLQLNLYKAILQRVLGIRIGKCYLVHFCHLKDDFDIYPCINLQNECNLVLDRMIKENGRDELLYRSI